MTTSYSHRYGGYHFDIQVRENQTDGDFVATLGNMERVASGSMISVDPGLQAQRGATRGDAFARLEMAVEQWVKNQTP
jgi:hypothetical protein